MASLVLLSISYFGDVAAGGDMSKDEPDPSVEALASNFAESLYILSGDFAYNFAFAKTDWTIDYYLDYDGTTGAS